MNKNLSDAMKNFWENKSLFEMSEINSKRSDTIKRSCIYMKKGSRSYPCKIDLVLSHLAKGHLIVSTPKNRDKVKKFIGEIPDVFFTK
jgi:hypothetical protein